jgi:FMN phosphatase YigB (HAD superfamily)
MSNKSACAMPGRNLCAPGGKLSALFIDLDGTVMVCEPYFQQARARFGYLMQMHGYDNAEAIELLRSINISRMKRHGVERDQLALAMEETYKTLCRKGRKKSKPVTEVLGMCRDIGNSPFFREPILFPNAISVLNRARHNFLLIGVTMGNREAQKYKISQGGLVLDHFIITPFDNKSDRVAELIKDLNIDPVHSAFIGNSVRSDGQCISETNVVLVPFEKGVFDQDEVPQSSEYEVFNLRDWRDVEERAIMRLVRRRERANALSSQSAHRSSCEECRCD